MAPHHRHSIRIIVGALGMWSVPGLARADVLQVGPDKPFATPSAAIAAASSGDEIEIDAGDYVDDFATIAVGDLVLRGVGGRPHLQSTVNAPNQKGIWVIQEGTPEITVENIEFSGAMVSAGDGNNGAGIRMQGSALTVRDCYFHDNQNGILAGGTPDFTVTIETSEFAYNGNPGSGQEHNVYVSGEASLFVFQSNYSHHSYSGHTLKSRAAENRILYNRIMDEADGTGSYVIDLPQGGLSYVIGNLLEQGPQAENHGTIIDYKGEGATNDDLHLYLSHNTIVNDWPGDTVFVRVHQADEVVAVNNLFVGQGTMVAFDDPATPFVDQGNLQPDDPGVVDLAAYDYRLLETSPAIDTGVDIDPSLRPELHYDHPAATSDRPVVGLPDVGAYEYGEEEPAGSTGAPGASSGADGSADDTAGGDGMGGSSGAGDDGASHSQGAGPGDDGDGTAATDGGSARDEGADGCGCRGSGREVGGSWWALFAVGAMIRRRRGCRAFFWERFGPLRPLPRTCK